MRLHNQLRLAQFIDMRTEVLDASDLVDEALLDPYAFRRDAHLQRLENQVNDNLTKRNLSNDEFFEEDDTLDNATTPATENQPAAETK